MVWDPERSETPVVRGFREFVLRSGRKLCKSRDGPQTGLSVGRGSLASRGRRGLRSPVPCSASRTSTWRTWPSRSRTTPTSTAGGSTRDSGAIQPHFGAAEGGGDGGRDRPAAGRRRLRRHGGLRRLRPRRPGARPAGARDRRARRVPALQGRARAVPGAAPRLVRLPRRARRAARDRVAGRARAGRRRRRAPTRSPRAATRSPATCRGCSTATAWRTASRWTCGASTGAACAACCWSARGRAARRTRSRRSSWSSSWRTSPTAGPRSAGWSGRCGATRCATARS